LIESDYYDSFYDDLESFDVSEEILDEMHGLDCTGVEQIAKRMQREKRMRSRSKEQNWLQDYTTL